MTGRSGAGAVDVGCASEGPEDAQCRLDSSSDGVRLVGSDVVVHGWGWQSMLWEEDRVSLTRVS